MSIPINIPPRIPTKGQYAITATWANQVREAIARLAARKTPSRRGGGGGKSGPFTPSLIVGGTTEAPIYKVTVSDGWVSEVIPGTNDPVAPACATYKPFNILWGADAVDPAVATDRREFTLAIGDQISVVVYKDDEGGFGGDLAPAGGPVELVAEPEESSGTPVSVHYNPPGGDNTTGDSGEIHYKLAVLRDVDTDHATPWLEMFLAGSNIYVERDLPLLENTSATGSSGIGRVFKEYNTATNQYKFRTVSKGAGQLQVNESADDIEIRGNDKTADLIFMQETDASPTELGRWSFEDGLSMEDDNLTITLPKAAAEGDDFNLENWPCSQDIESPPTAPNWVLYFRKGLAYTTNPEDAVTAKKVMYDGFSCYEVDGP